MPDTLYTFGVVYTADSHPLQTAAAQPHGQFTTCKQTARTEGQSIDSQVLAL